MFISVVIPVHNGQKFLRESVKSILAQGHDPLEIIVVDDGSTDDTPAVIESLGDPVRSVRLDQNCGPATARNIGIEGARGSVIGFLDVDDLWPAGRLAVMIEPLEADPECSVVKGYARVCHTLDPDANPHALSPPVLGPWIGSASIARRYSGKLASLSRRCGTAKTSTGSCAPRNGRADAYLEASHAPGQTPRNQHDSGARL